MEKRCYRAAIIGSGMIAGSAHIPAFLTLGDRVCLSAICGRNRDTVTKLADTFAIPHRYTDAGEMLRREKPDLVSICTPNQSHEAYIQLALEAGCHVICEKPVCLDSAHLRRLYQLAAKKGKLLVACQNVRFRPEWFQAKACLEAGMLGEVVDVRFQRIRSRGIPSWGSFHRKEASGGGCMADIGVHMLDAMLWILGNPTVRSVTGFTSDRLFRTTPALCCEPGMSGAGNAQVTGKNIREEYDVEEYATGIARLDGEIPLSFQVAWAANLPETTAFQILGTKASLTSPGMQLFDGKQFQPCPPPPAPWNDPAVLLPGESGHRHVFAHVVGALDGTQRLEITPEQTQNVCMALELFYRSAETGTECFARETGIGGEEMPQWKANKTGD